MRNTVIEASGLEEKVQELQQLINHETSDGKVFVVIEGTDDQKLYGYFLDDNKIVFYVAQSCYYVVNILKKLNTNNQFNKRLIGIKDADFDHILNIQNQIPNLFVTDKHDKEMSSICNETEKRLHSEYNIPQNTNLISDAKNELLNLSFLRLYNEQNSIGINFKNLCIQKIYTGKVPIILKVCVDHVKTICNNSSLPQYPSDTDVQNLINSYNNNIDFDQITRGHDLEYALLYKIKEITNNKAKVSIDNIKLIFNLCYNFTQFKKSQLFKEMDNWMNTNGHELWKN